MATAKWACTWTKSLHRKYPIWADGELIVIKQAIITVVNFFLKFFKNQRAYLFEHDKQVACVYHNEMGNIIDGAVINAHPFQIEIVEPLKPTSKRRHCLDRNCIDDVTLELPEIKHKPSTVIITEVRAVVVDCLVDISRVLHFQIHSDDDEQLPQKRILPA